MLYLAGANSFDGQHTLFGAGSTEASFLAVLGEDLGTAKQLYASDFQASERHTA